MISPLIEWNHEKTWHVFRDDEYEHIKQGKREINISLKDKKYAYLSGHKIHDTVIFPAGEFLVSFKNSQF